MDRDLKLRLVAAENLLLAARRADETKLTRSKITAVKDAIESLKTEIDNVRREDKLSPKENREQIDVKPR